MKPVGIGGSTSVNYHEETNMSYHNADLGSQVSMSPNNETESYELGLDESCVCDDQGIVLRTIKSSYNMYIGTVMSGRVDCTCHASQNAPCHSDIITLVEHIMELNDAFLFHTHMNKLKETCAVLRGNDVQNKNAFPAEPPNFIDPKICCKFSSHYVIKMPVWAIQHCLSSAGNMSKKYSFEISNEREVLNATDGAFIICGLLNQLCTPQDAERHAAEHPHDPLYDIVSPNCRGESLLQYCSFLLLVVSILQDLFPIQVVCRQKTCGYAIFVWHLLQYCICFHLHLFV